MTTDKLVFPNGSVIEFNNDDICPDFDAVCFEPNRSGCEDGITEPLIGKCPMWED